MNEWAFEGWLVLALAIWWGLGGFVFVLRGERLFVLGERPGWRGGIGFAFMLVVTLLFGGVGLVLTVLAGIGLLVHAHELFDWLGTFPVLHMSTALFGSAFEAAFGLAIMLGLVLLASHALIGWPADWYDFWGSCRWLVTQSTGKQATRRLKLLHVVGRVALVGLMVLFVYVWNGTYERNGACAYLRHHGDPTACIDQDSNPYSAF